MGQARDEAGNIWETDAQGNPVRLVQAAGQGGQVVSLPPDQVEQARLQNEARRLAVTENTDARAQAQAPLRDQLLEAQIRKALADAAKAEQGTAGAATGDARLQARTANINSLVEQINRVQELYESGPGETSGIRGLADYFPTEENKQFDAAAAGLAEQGLAAFRVPGVGAQSDAELRQFVQANRPSAGDFDVTITEKLRQLRGRVDSTREAMGLPPAQWTGEGVEQRDDGPNAMAMDRLMGNASHGAPVGFGGRGGTTPIPPEMQAEYEAGLPAVLVNGRIDPQRYAAWRSELDRKYGFSGDSFQTHLTWANETNALIDKPGGMTVGTTIPAPERNLNSLEMIRNSLVNNPVGAGAVGYTDAFGLGGVSALAGEEMDALGDAQPLGMTLGQIGGTVSGTGAIAKLGRHTLGRAAPGLLGGGGKAQFARNLATDATYGAGYGAVTEGDPLTGATLATLGSAGGQGVGKALGATVGGLKASPAVEALRQRKIPMTVAQQLGGFAKSVEDKAQSLPLIGDMIRARRTQGLEAFNRNAFDDAGQPIGATVGDIGQEGLEQLGEKVGGAYDSATSGVSVQFDPDFVGDMTAAESLGQMLPDDYQAVLNKTVQNRLWPATDPGVLTGENYQQAMRGFKSKRASAGQATPGFEEEYRDALTGVMDALEGQMVRGGGQQVVSGLAAANAANRNLGTLRDAATRAAGGSETGTPFMFTPSHLQRAGLATQKKYPGARPFADLADNAQTVLPSRVPDSGTAGRLAQMAGPGALIGSGTAVGYGATGGDPSGAGTGAGLTTLATLALLLGGTKRGQQALGGALFARPKVAKNIGAKVRKKAGLFGSATLPFVLHD